MEPNYEEKPSSGLPRWLVYLLVAVLVIMLILVFVAVLLASGLISGQQPTPFPTPAGEPDLLILEPDQGAALDVASPVLVSGTGKSLFEGTVIVEAFDDDGNVLARSATTLDGQNSGTGGAGAWQVSLEIELSTPRTGFIFAFSTSPADGSIVASSSVEVSYFNSSSVQPAIVILDPDNNATLPLGVPFTASGAGAGLNENNVVVRVLDANGEILAEEATVLNSETLGGIGTWSVNLTVPATTTQRGTLVAFSPSPVNSTPDAEDSIDINFNIPPPTATATPIPGPNLTIESPQNGDTVPVAQPFEVLGTGSNLFENTVVVRALDEEGTVLDEQTTTLSADQNGGSGSWSVQLTVTIQPGSFGIITAFSPSSTEAKPDASASVAVLYGDIPERSASLKINEPQNRSILDISSPIEVNGIGSGLFENNVVVIALDYQGNLLAEATTTVDAEDTGGEGPWSVQLTIETEIGTPGVILAYARSPQDGSVETLDGVTVLYGQPLAAVLPVPPGEATSTSAPPATPEATLETTPSPTATEAG